MTKKVIVLPNANKPVKTAISEKAFENMIERMNELGFNSISSYLAFLIVSDYKGGENN